MKLLIISGRSGSGKSVCLKALEDVGYNCTDNLPISLLDKYTNLYINQEQIAVGIDARNLPSKLLKFDEYINNIKQAGVQVTIVYLDADNNTLIKRFSETRRRHPLTTDTISLKEAIKLEQQLLNQVASISDVTIHTTGMTAHQLRTEILNRIGISNNNQLSVLLKSFGYKQGIPTDANFVFDVRCLPNPYWNSDLRDLTGLDQPVIKYLESKSIVSTMYETILQFMEQWIPHIKANHSRYLTIAIGCTGGQHRSVYLTEKLAKYFKSNYSTLVRHRELDNTK